MMQEKDIIEGESYVNKQFPHYFRTVDMIVESPSRPGGKVVAWSTEAFNVRTENGHRGKEHGKCGIKTFAKWADKKLSE